MKNKTTLLALVILAAISLPKLSSAQYRAFVLGVKAAPSISWLKTTEKTYSSEGVKPGFSWGVVSEFYFARNYAIVSGVNFNYQGGKLSYPDLISGNQVLLTRNYRIRYIEIPAVLKLKTNEMGKFRYFGQLGLGFGVRLNSKGSDEYREGTQTISGDYRDIDGLTNLFRASMIVGGGVEYPFDKNTSLVLGVNFNNGFTDALKGENAINQDYRHEGKPNFVELHVGVMF
jgi:hypothetical protein